MIRFRVGIYLFALIVVCISFASAQGPATGTPPFGSFSGSPETINNANLNAHWDFSVVHKPGRGTDFGYDLTYDSSVWSPVTSGSTKAWTPAFNWGWIAQSAIKTGYISYTAITSNCDFPPPQFGSFTDFRNFVYHDPFGISHPFAGAMEYDPKNCNLGNTETTLNATAKDGSGFQFAAALSGASVTTHTVVKPNGEVINPPLNLTNGYSGATATATDRNGNQISVTSTSSTATFTDTLGTTAITVSGGATPASPLVLTYTGPTGSAITYTVKYTAFSVQTKFNCSGITEYGPISNNLVSEIDLPDGSKYSFVYEPTPGVTGKVTGRLASVTLPTGGTISYSYSGGGTGVNGISCTDGSGATVTRTTPDGTWTYAQVKGTGAASTTTVTDPQGNQTVLQFQGIYETQRKVYQGSTSGTLMQTVNTCYNGAASPCTTTAVLLPITQRAAGTILDFSGLQGYGVSFWNSNGQPTEVDSYGFGSGANGPLLKKTLYMYASLGNITAFRQTVKVTDASGNVLSQTNDNYDETAPTATSGIAQHVSVTGSRGNMTSVQTCTVLPSCSSSLTTRATYDDTGQPLTATDSNGNVTSFSYADNFYTDNGANPPQAFTPSTPTNAYLTKVTVPILGVTATYGYYVYTGQTAVSVDQNGADSYAHYDSIGRPSIDYLAPRPNGDRGWTVSQYPNLNTVDSYISITSTSPSAGCTSCRHQQENFDSSGRVSTDILVNDPDGQTTVATSYDSLGRVASTTNPYRTLTDATYGTVVPTYDALGRVTQVTEGDGSVKHEYYGGTVVAAGGAASQLCSSSTYGLGYPILIVDASGKKRQTWSDGLGRVFESDEPDSSGNLTVATCNSFDLLNNLMQVVQGTQTRSFVYDALSRVTSSTAPEAGTTTLFYTTTSGALCSGNPSFVCRKTDARAITATTGYDTLNRLVSITYSDGTPQVQYFYDQTSYNGLTILNGKGRLTGMSDASGLSAYSYDLLGQTVAENHTVSGVTKSILYSYNLDGSISSMTYPSGRVVSYAYSNAQRPLSALDSVTGNYFAKSVVYAPQGAQASILYGNTSTFGGVTEGYTYNSRLQLKNQTASSSAGVVLNLNYSFPGSPNNNGRITSVVNNINNARTVSASYDSLNRIASAQSQATSGTNCWGQNFGYDRWSNLLSITLTQCSGGALSVSVANNHITNTGFSYDSAGNMSSDGSNTYAYDAANHLISAAGVTYIYDARDLRVKKSSGTLYWRSYFGEAFAESDFSGNIQNEYVFFGGHRAARIDSSSNVYYYFEDRLGSVRAITNASGVVCYDADYTPFGTELPFTNSCPQNYKFSGFERDQETGLDYAIYRQYSPRLGRFLQPDPLAGQATKPQSLNRYAYVLNDPLNWTDHLGLSPCPAGFHQANAAEVLAAAQKFLSGNINYGHANSPTELDCSQLVARVASAVAGYSVPVTVASDIYNGNQPNGDIAYAESSATGEVGDIVAFKGNGYFHVGIVSSTSPFGYIASNGSVDQGKTKAPKYGPGTAPRSSFSDNPGTRRFYALCIKDKTSSPATVVKAAASGQSGALTAGFDLFDILDSIAHAPTGSVTTQIVNTGAIASDGSIVPTITVDAVPVDTTSVDLGTLILPPDPVLPPLQPIVSSGGGGGETPVEGGEEEDDD